MPVKLGSSARRVLVALVDVAAAGVGLPDLHELVAHRAPVAVDDPAGHHHPLADRLAAVLDGEVGLERVEVPVPEDRRPQLDALRVGLLQRLGRVPQQAGAVGRVVQPRLRLAGRLVVRLADLLDLVADLGLGQRGGVGAGDGGHPSTLGETRQSGQSDLPLNGMQ